MRADQSSKPNRMLLRPQATLSNHDSPDQGDVRNRSHPPLQGHRIPQRTPPSVFHAQNTALRPWAFKTGDPKRPFTAKLPLISRRRSCSYKSEPFIKVPPPQTHPPPEMIKEFFNKVTSIPSVPISKTGNLSMINTGAPSLPFSVAT